MRSVETTATAPILKPSAHGPARRRGHPAKTDAPRSLDSELWQGPPPSQKGPGLTTPLARLTWTPRWEPAGSTRDSVTKTTKDAAGLPGSGHDQKQGLR